MENWLFHIVLHTVKVLNDILYLNVVMMEDGSTYAKISLCDILGLWFFDFTMFDDSFNLRIHRIHRVCVLPYSVTMGAYLLYLEVPTLDA